MAASWTVVDDRLARWQAGFDDAGRRPRRRGTAQGLATPFGRDRQQKGHRLYDWLLLDPGTAGGQQLLVRRSISKPTELAYYICHSTYPMPERHFAVNSKGQLTGVHAGGLFACQT